jgi:hypothetical protein
MLVLRKSGKKDFIMDMSTWLKAGVLALSVSLLAACGGGDAAAPGGGTPNQPLPEVPWGSPAVFVTPGQTSASFALSGCYFEHESEGGESGSLYQTKLVISSEGDVSIAGTLSELSTATAATLLSMKFAEVTLSNWGVSGNTESPTYSLHMMKLGRTPDGGEVELGVNYQDFENGGQDEGVFLYDNAQSKYIYGCSLDSPLALKTLINEARVAKHMAQGVAAVDDLFINYYSPESPPPSGIEGDVIFWSYPAIEEFGELPQQNFRFNSQTGTLLTSIGADTSATMSTISFALPSATSNNSGTYSESTCRNMQLYDFKEAKTLIVVGNDDFQSALIATRYGDKLMPISIIAFFGLIMGGDGGGEFDGAPDCLRPRLHNDFDR